MNKIIPIIAILCLIVATPLMGQTKKAGQVPKAGSCLGCHADMAAVLPKDHKPVKGTDITACLGCHKPDPSGKPEPNDFSARLHRTHVKPEAKTECTLCHVWAPGKRISVKGTKASLGAVSKGNMSLLKAIFASWAASSYLDAIHDKGNIVCLACHGKTLPEAGDTVENDRCLSCHGPMDTLAARSAPKDFPDRNPHKSHLGDIACSVCHHVHSASKVYCLECHAKFTMKLPEGE